MTVAAIILAASPESALADADGMPSVRRIADVAWSGGATPIIVVAHDPEGAVATALAGSPVTLAEPAPIEQGPAGQMIRGIEVALATVRETSGAFIWPSRMAWVGPETVTSMIEAHGPAAGALLTPTFDDEPGWPVLLPLEALPALRAVAPDRMPPTIPGRSRRGRRAATAHRPRATRARPTIARRPAPSCPRTTVRQSPPVATSTSGAR